MSRYKREYMETLYGLVPVRHGRRSKQAMGKLAPTGKGQGRKGLSAEMNERILRPHRGAQPMGAIAGGEIRRMLYRFTGFNPRRHVARRASSAERAARVTRRQRRR